MAFFFIIPLFIVALILGLFIGFSSIDYLTKKEIRTRLSAERYDSKPMNRLAETRRESRNKGGEILVDVRAPILDSAGVPLASEELRFSGELLDISANGIAMLSQHFLPIGIDLEVTCASRKFSFSTRKAEVRNLSITPRGLRIGMQFFEPLKMKGEFPA